MGFKESETVELKSVVVDDIKKEIIAFAIAKAGNYILAFRTMERLSDWMIRTELPCRSAI